MNIDLTGLDKAAVLAALYNGSQPLGMGYLHFDPADMTVEEARRLLDDPENRSDLGFRQTQAIFEYIKGRVIKVDLRDDSIDPWGYDRDNGQGAAERIITQLRALSEVPS